MSAPARDREAAAKRLFRRLLRLLPADFRGDYGREMSLDFQDQLAAAEPQARGRLVWRTAVGLVATAVREHWDVLCQDFRGSWRSWRRAPGTALVALATLGLGVGLATTIFAVADGVLLRPLPYPDPEGLVAIHDTNLAKGIERIGGTSGNVADWRRRIRELSGISGFYTMGRNLSAGAGAEVVLTAQVSTDFFPIFGVRPELGRTFTPEETERALFNTAAAPVGTDPVAILSHRIWVRRFGSDPGVIGRKITLERREFEVVGVMPPGFAVPGPEVELWIPWGWKDPPRDQHYIGVVGRLASGVTLAAAQASLDAVTAALGEEYPETNRGWGARLTPLHDAVVGGTRPILVVFVVAGLLLLGLAAVDLTGLQLVRASGRLEEAAVRLALGASRGRLVRGLLTENALLATLGAVLAAGVAAAALAGLPRLWPDLPRLGEVALDARAIAVAVVAAVAVAVAAGIVPALTVSRARAAAGLRVDGGRTTAGPARDRLRRTLVVAEVALTVVLLVGAGLLVKSFVRLAAVDPGFHPDGVVVAPIFLDMEGYGSGEKARGYYARLFERLAAIPGVESVGGATALPTSPLGPDFERPVWAEGTAPEPGTAPQADVRMVTPDYFRTLGIRLERGRVFAPSDGPEARKVAIVNTRLAALLWPGENPVGRRIVADYSGTYPYEVVGVVGDVRFRGPRSAPRPEIFFPHAQRSYLILNVAVKTSGDAVALIPAVFDALREIDPRQPPQQVTPLGDLVSATVARDRLATELLSGFAAAAVALAALGIYGVLAHRVRQRRAEIGVRLALGARPADLARSVCGDGLRLALAGCAVGVTVALAAGGIARGVLFEVAPTDPAIFACVLGAVVAIALASAGLPALRASRVEPREALR